MKDVKINVICYDEFSVEDASGNPVIGLVNGDFTKYLYNPTGTEISGSIPVTVTGLGNGLYRLSFTPDTLGSWAVQIVNALYCHWGKHGNYFCVSNSLDDLVSIESGKWKIVNNQMIFYKEDNITEIMRFNLYDSGGLPTQTNVMERRRV